MAKSVLKNVCLPTTLIAFIGCQNVAEQNLTVSGPETKDVASRVTGYVVWTKSGTELLALSLPAMVRTVVRRTAPEDAEYYPTIHAASGPDSEGRIAYIEDHFFVADKKDEKHLLKTVKVNGTEDTEVFSRPGNAMWATSAAGRGEIGTHLALAPSGGKAAFLSGLSGRQMPRALLHEGNLEIWDVAKKLRHNVTTKAIDQPMSWFPDGKRLAYVKLVPRNELPESATGLEKFGQYFGESWNVVPAIHILDAETGQSIFVHVGWVPVVSFDGKAILVGGWDDHSEFTWNRLQLESRDTTPIKWPGDAGGAIAAPTENIVLYKGLPTAGAPIKYTKNNSPLRGPKLILTLKVAVIDSDDFQTVVPEIDPRDLVSFGRVLNND